MTEIHPVNQAIEGILAPHRAEIPTHRFDYWRGDFERTTLFGPLEEHVFANEQHLDADGMADRIGVTVPYGTEVQIAERR